MRPIRSRTVFTISAASTIMSKGHSCGSRSISMKSGLSRCGERLIHGIVVDAAEIHEVQQAGAVLGEDVRIGLPLCSESIISVRSQPGKSRACPSGRRTPP